MAHTLLAASVAIVRQTDVLLIERNRPPSEGLWTLPGGRLEPGETAEACAIREIREELGLAVFGLKPLRVMSHGRFQLQVFGTQVFEGEIRPDAAEVRAWRWVRPHQLSTLRTTPGLGEVVQAAFRIFDRT
jgi:ADP-ribose pyrophosphatase YjhB (NUDIX family)